MGWNEYYIDATKSTEVFHLSFIFIFFKKVGVGASFF